MRITLLIEMGALVPLHLKSPHDFNDSNRFCNSCRAGWLETNTYKKANQSIGVAQIFQTLLADIRAVPVQVSENKSALTAPKPNQDTTQDTFFFWVSSVPCTVPVCLSRLFLFLIHTALLSPKQRMLNANKKIGYSKYLVWVGFSPLADVGKKKKKKQIRHVA